MTGTVAGAAVMLAAPASAAAQQAGNQASMDVSTSAIHGNGIPGPQLHAQQHKSALATQLSADAGPQSAGAYINDRGRLVVNVTSRAAAAKVRGDGAKVRVVDHSLTQLRGVKTRLDRLGGVPGLSWGVDVVHNTVTVTVPRTVHGAGLQAFLSKARSSGPVRVEHVATAPRPMLGPGDAIHVSGGRCSMAYAGQKGGTDYVVTAGHCTNIGSQWTTGSGQTIGTTAASHFPGSDWGVIRVTNSSLPLSNGSVTEIGDATVGARVCKEGSTTGHSCGQVEALNQTVRYQEGTVRNLIKTDVCVQPGDSGGQLYAGSTGVGITSGGSQGGCGASFESFFFPASIAFGSFGLSLKGSGNEPPGNGPEASFTANCSDDLSCTFDASGSTAGSGSITSYGWSFGDGGSGSGQTVTHQYSSDGTYEVTLNVTNSNGDTDSVSQNIDASSGGGGGGHTGSWEAGVHYNVGDTVTYDGQKYKCRIAHTSQSTWDPVSTPALWQPV